MRLARTNQASDDNEPGGLHHGIHLADQRALVLGFEVAGPLERLGHPPLAFHLLRRRNLCQLRPNCVCTSASISFSLLS